MSQLPDSFHERLVFWNSIHLEVASDSYCFLINSSWFCRPSESWPWRFLIRTLWVTFRQLSDRQTQERQSWNAVLLDFRPSSLDDPWTVRSKVGMRFKIRFGGWRVKMECRINSSWWRMSEIWPVIHSAKSVIFYEIAHEVPFGWWKVQLAIFLEGPRELTVDRPFKMTVRSSIRLLETVILGLSTIRVLFFDRALLSSSSKRSLGVKMGYELEEVEKSS